MYNCAIKRYAQTTMGRVNIMRKNARRNARLAGVKVIEGPKLRAIYRRCQELRQWFDVVVDHIIPLAKGGRHCSSNLQIIYRKENERKHDKLNYIPSVIFT